MLAPCMRACHRPARGICLVQAFAKSRMGPTGLSVRGLGCEWHVRSTPSTSRRTCVLARASWGAPVEFSAAKIVSNKATPSGLNQLLVDVGPTLAAGYKVGGQYIQAKPNPDTKPGFLAIASGPDANNQGVLELLIKPAPGSTAEAICGLEAGAELLVSPVQGKGFPLDRIPAPEFPTVLMFATGSGISPLKAVIESGALGSRPDVRLYYGTRSKELTAYEDLIPAWEKQGIKVVLVHSGDSKTYVQHVFAKEPALADPKRTAVLLCGQKDMCTAVTDLAKAQGVEQVLMNF